MSLQGKVAMVTGGASCIGRATALELAANEKLGRRALYEPGDVGDRASVEQAIERTVTQFGRLDILVNNAGVSVRKPLLELEIADVETVWRVILWGAFHCSQLAARQMVKQGGGGNIVMISSVHASRHYPNATAYNGAKAAVNHMAATWARELAPHGIRVNAIEPGWIDTPGEHKAFSEETIREEGKKLPFGRLGRPEEIARAVRFLVSDDGSYVTGSVLRVDGGFVLFR